jgi:hypothetical protein
MRGWKIAMKKIGTMKPLFHDLNICKNLLDKKPSLIRKDENNDGSY